MIPAEFVEVGEYTLSVDWHCWLSARSRVYNKVCLSVRPSHYSTAESRLCGFAAVGPAGRRYRSIAARPALSSSRAAAAQRQMRAVPRRQPTQEAERRRAKLHTGRICRCRRRSSYRRPRAYPAPSTRSDPMLLWYIRCSSYLRVYTNRQQLANVTYPHPRYAAKDLGSYHNTDVNLKKR